MVDFKYLINCYFFILMYDRHTKLRIIQALVCYNNIDTKIFLKLISFKDLILRYEG